MSGDTRAELDSSLLESTFLEIDERGIAASDTEDLQGFATGEFLGHSDGSYGLSKLSKEEVEGKIISVEDSDGVTREYRVTRLQLTDKAIYAHALVGVDADNPRVHVTFRGTKGDTSLVRDLEDNPGADSFAKDRQNIVAQLNTLVAAKAEEIGGPVDLSLSGHSLGGSDTQNCFAAVTQALAENASDEKLKQNPSKNPLVRKAKELWERRHLDTSAGKIPAEYRRGLKIGKLTINTQNSAGVSSKIADAVAKNLEYLNGDKLHKGQRVEVDANFLMVAGDGVQQTGQANVLAKASPDIAKVKVLKVDTGQAGRCFLTSPLGTLKAHKKKHFVAGHNTGFLNYQLFSNETEAGAASIQRELENKSSRINGKGFFGSMLGFGRKILHSVTSWFSGASKKLPAPKLEEMAEIPRPPSPREQVLAGLSKTVRSPHNGSPTSTPELDAFTPTVFESFTPGFKHRLCESVIMPRTDSEKELFGDDLSEVPSPFRGRSMLVQS